MQNTDNMSNKFLNRSFRVFLVEVTIIKNINWYVHVSNLVNASEVGKAHDMYPKKVNIQWNNWI